jgi:hypothetical protein
MYPFLGGTKNWPGISIPSPLPALAETQPVGGRRRPDGIRSLLLFLAKPNPLSPALGCHRTDLPGITAVWTLPRLREFVLASCTFGDWQS